MKFSHDKFTRLVIECIITVHQTLGPGFLENVYRRALVIELRKRGLQVEAEKEIVIFYDGQEIGRHRLDLVVNASIILELKTVEELGQAHYAQVRSYLKATDIELALLVNFAKEKADFRRIEGHQALTSSCLRIGSGSSINGGSVGPKIDADHKD